MRLFMVLVRGGMILAVGSGVIVAEAQLNISSRQSTQRYTYTYGGGPDSHTDDVTATESIMPPTDDMTTTFTGATAGVWFEHSWDTGVDATLYQQYQLVGPTNNASKIMVGASSEMSCFASGDIGLASIFSNNPGNEIKFNFSPNSTILYRLKGWLTGGDGGANVSLQYFDGFTWQYMFSTFFMSGGSGAFNVTRTLVSGAPHRLIAALSHGVGGTESETQTLAYTFEPVGSVSGTVLLNDYDGLDQNETVDFEIRQSGAVLETVVDVPLSSSGAYSFYTSAIGTYDVVAKGRTWLGQAANGVSLSLAGVSNVNFSLSNGDVDGDNEVGIGDYAILSSAYGSVPGDANWELAADLNGDESVDIGDYAILSGNYGLVGD